MPGTVDDFMRRFGGDQTVDDREAAHYQVFNAMGLEGGQKIFVVLVHPVPSPNLSARKQPRSFRPPRPAVHERADFASNGIRPP